MATFDENYLPGLQMQRAAPPQSDAALLPRSPAERMKLLYWQLRGLWDSGELSYRVERFRFCLTLAHGLVAEAEARKRPAKAREPAPAFSRPTPADCELLATQCGIPTIEGRKFHSYYEANGWRVGRNPMRSVSAAMAHWALNWRSRNNGATVKSLVERRLDRLERNK